MSSNTTATQLPEHYQAMVDHLQKTLPSLLGNNLYSLGLYGSAVRGNIVEDVSDLNILIILNESTPTAHEAIANAITGKVRVEPFVLSRQGIERSFSAFAMKFRSISRNFRLLAGNDPFKDMTFSQNVLRFLCEQQIRNLRLRSTHAFIRFGRDNKRYQNYLLDVESQIIIELAEVLRLNGSDMPNEVNRRVEAIKQGFGIDAPVLNELLEFKQKPRRLEYEDVKHFHSGIYQLLDQIVRWMEATWPTTM